MGFLVNGIFCLVFFGAMLNLLLLVAPSYSIIAIVIPSAALVARVILVSHCGGGVIYLVE